MISEKLNIKTPTLFLFKQYITDQLFWKMICTIKGCFDNKSTTCASSKQTLHYRWLRYLFPYSEVKSDTLTNCLMRIEYNFIVTSINIMLPLQFVSHAINDCYWDYLYGDVKKYQYSIFCIKNQKYQLKSA